MICVAIPGPTYEDAQVQISDAIRHADLVELRLDLFHKIDTRSLKKILKPFSIPFIFTFKRQNLEGTESNDQAQFLDQIRLLADLQPAYLDLDWSNKISPKFIFEIAQNYPRIQLILSYHHYMEIPKDLNRIYEEMSFYPVHYYKFSIKVHASLEALNLLNWAKNRDKKILLVCMGEHGQISRILNPILGHHFTYASLNSKLKTAEGQLSARILSNLYSYKKLNVHTKMFGLIGDPVDQSLSHVTHNHYFQTIGLNAVYVKMVVRINELFEFLELAKNLNFQGFSVTMPLKEAVMPYLDWIDPQAKEMGACNTIVIREGKLLGYNTDSIGALNAIEHAEKVMEKRIVILGAGGAARAIAYEAERRGAKVTLLNRNSEKARLIAQQIGCRWGEIESMDVCCREGYEILINCTPLFMPIESAYILSDSIVMDINTRAIDTSFLKAAKEKNCRIVYGYEMFIEQAIGQFNYWLGSETDEHECYQIIEKALHNSLNLQSHQI